MELHHSTAPHRRIRVTPFGDTARTDLVLDRRAVRSVVGCSVGVDGEVAAGQVSALPSSLGSEGGEPLADPRGVLVAGLGVEPVAVRLGR